MNGDVPNRTPEQPSNRDRTLRREIVLVTTGRLREMREQAIALEGFGDGAYHWHWAAALTELIARREGKL